MNWFRFWRDPLCISAIAAYGLNRWFFKPMLGLPFLHDHFDDLLLIPAALPLVLWLQRCLGLRLHNHPPSGREVMLHLVVWSVICEFIGPRFLGRGTADIMDVLVYAVGGLGAWFYWNRPKSIAFSRS